MMKLTRLLPVAFVFVACIGLGMADHKPPNRVDISTRFATLAKAYYQAQTKYYEPFSKAKTDEERAKIKLDPATNPAKEYLPKFKALARQAGKTDAGFDAWMMVVQTAQGMNDTDDQVKAIDAMVRDYVNSPKIAQLTSMLQYSVYSLPKDQRTKKIAAWTAAIGKSTNPEVKAAALYAKAQTLGQDGRGDVKAAGAVYDKLLAAYPATSYAKRAKADIFELEHLSIGKTAPDFDASDQDGTAFKLSDYRGKVVVLDFWGFW